MPMICRANVEKPEVAVIGAGIAGMTAAYRLEQQGFDVHVYEARGRVGGRILSVQVGGQVGELGGQNITDGGEAENFLRLVQEMGLELNRASVLLGHSYFTGESFISTSELNDFPFKEEELKERIDRAVAQSQNMREVMDQVLERGDVRNRSISTRMAAYEGAPVEKLSTLYAETFYHMIQGGLSSAHQGHSVELISVKGGNSKLLEKIAEKLQGRIHLVMPLSSISKEDGAYQLTFQNGEKATAKRVVLAIPCTVYESISFEEGVIPIDRLEAIQNVRYGTNAKILIPFEKRPEKRVSMHNDRTIAFFNPSCALLTLYYTGEAGRFSSETIEAAYLADRQMLEMGFGSLCPPCQPRWAQDLPLIAYEHAVGYSWPSDPFARGSYSYIAPGQEGLLTSLTEVNGVKVKSLFAPIDGLYFAGEHATIMLDVGGTMEAACESGERAAQMIIQSNI